MNPLARNYQQRVDVLRQILNLEGFFWASGILTVLPSSEKFL